MRHLTEQVRSRLRGRRLWAPIVAALLAASTVAAAQSFEVVPDGSHAGYRVSEKVVGLTLPRDAVGTTTAVAGSVHLGADGAVLDGSVLTVDLRGLTSDEARRDRYLQRSTLTTSTYPDAVLTVRELTGLPHPLPSDGTVTFEVVGDLTVRGVTVPVTWQATAAFAAGEVTVDAATDVTFDDFGLTRPVVGPILAVSDPIHLEVHVLLRPATP